MHACIGVCRQLVALLLLSANLRCGINWKLHDFEWKLHDFHRLKMWEQVKIMSLQQSLPYRQNHQTKDKLYLSIARHNQRPLSLIKECIIWNKDWENWFLSQSLDVSTSFLFQKETIKSQGSNKYSITHVKVDSLYLTWKAGFSAFSRWWTSGQLIFLPSIFDLTSATQGLSGS